MSSNRRLPIDRIGRLAALLVAVLCLALAPRVADAAQKDAAGLLVTWETADGSTFNAVVTDPESIERIEAAFPGDGQAGIPNGTLAAGDGGVNAPHEWHMVDVELVDFTIELCDATATMVDEDLDYWLNTVGAFCPWTATVIAVEPYGGTATPMASPSASPQPNGTPTDPTGATGGLATALPNTGAGGTAEIGVLPWAMASTIASGVALGGGFVWYRTGHGRRRGQRWEVSPE